jgi:hypothetical protein
VGNKKETIKAKQARKSVVVDINDDSDGGECNKYDSGGNGKKNSKKSVRESKRDLGEVKVGDAVALVRMEVEVEKLATKEAEAEARARTNLKKKQKKRGMGMTVMVIGKEAEVVQNICGMGRANGKGNMTSTSKPKSKSKPKEQPRRRKRDPRHCAERGNYEFIKYDGPPGKPGPRDVFKNI